MFSSNTSAVSGDAVFVEDIFSTTLYTGNGSTQTITNGIDLSTKGGLVWAKMRSNGSATGNVLFDTARGASQKLETNTTGASSNWTPYGVSAFGSTGFTVADDGAGNYITNNSGVNYVSWTFRKQPKFFDVVTYTGNDTAGRTIAHNLGSVPGCIIVKATNSTLNWFVYHRSLGNTKSINLNLTSAATTVDNWGNTTPTSTVFTVDSGSETNQSGVTYVAYLFAHNAGGFGLTGTDNVISCGSYTGNGSTDGPTIDLGYEPQWLLIKSSSASSTAWILVDNMRGMTVGSADAYLKPNSSDAETTSLDLLSPTATGFKLTSTLSSVNGANDYIYIAIRRGPMKVPTSGTSVLQTLTYTGNGSSGRIYSGVTTVPDLAIATSRSNTSPKNWCDRLRGENPMISTSTDGESGTSQEGKTIIAGSANGTVTFGSYWGDAAVNTNGYTYVNYLLSRAPSFFDEVCYTGTGSVLSLTHNLGVAPEFILIKCRSGSSYWILGSNFGASTYALKDDWGANASNASRAYSSTVGFNAQPTATTVSLSTNSALNVSGSTYAMWMWATCAGVSKVGTYTGTGALQTINCGFTSGARFVLITRIGVVGDVNTYVYDSARGITSSNDPYLLLETSSAEVTSTNYVDTDSTGFKVTAAASSTINVSGGSYIFLAIA